MPAIKKVEVCVSNLELGSQEVWDRLAESHPEIRLRRWGCLGWCHRCIHGPAVLIDDTTYVEAEDADALYQKVLDYLAE